ncbi:radical SAM protein [Ruminococcus flavefaciens]|uniref:Radical SAM core domain-containing protein n=1 Tax=Ruminococcus flavefaciens 007c TaxID=1341157 RepID=W7UV32_RUMFL|nr:radical SAM protein [Ruminococcus flavefaciens]EWM55034.1 hypothetical protein RF007C_05020 [Ruminococcus flavefaciens 007c]
MNETFKASNYVIYEKNRIFIDICEEGCGSGCKYCYVQSKDKDQKLLSIKQIKSICEYIYDNYMGRIKILSLCPNTEPLKSKESIESVQYIISFFQKTDCYIQISTKEIVPYDFLKKINSYGNQIYINISIPVINNPMIEPKARTVDERIRNFQYMHLFKNINFSLYIKPFFKQETDKYLEIINKYKIETVYIGPVFNQKSEIPCTSLYDKKQCINIICNQEKEINDFMLKLRSFTKANVFISSVCKIYNDYGTQCPYIFLGNNHSLCQDCKLKGEKNEQIA